MTHSRERLHAAPQLLPEAKTMPALFQLGQITATPGALEAIPMEVITASIRRHVTGDYGDLDDDDKQANTWSIEHGERILSAYQHGESRYYVITERDRSQTTVLLCEEY
jgi:hypothetical protein